MKFQKRVLQLAIALDQTAGTVVGLFLHNGAWADETLSARAFREGNHSEGWAKFRKFVDALFFWQDNHCYIAYISEKERQHLAPQYRPVED